MNKPSLLSPTLIRFNLWEKIRAWRVGIPIFLFMGLPCYMMLISVIDSTEPELAAKNVWHIYDNASIYFLLAYLFISDGLLTGRPTGEPETLNLLFTRPITRTCYVLSKFFCGFIGSSVVLLISAAMTLGIATTLGITENPIDSHFILSIFLNSLIFSSFYVCLHAMPSMLGLIAYLFFSGCQTVGDIMSIGYSQNAPTFFKHVKDAILFFNYWFGDVFPSTVDFSLIASSFYACTELVVVYLSNLSLFLFFAIFMLSIREFSYGAD
ncbi:MAG: hypothetical protein KIT34_03070 [Cyanobacteria bacterium TGS_CYA1]|nr:hypothetical protein [Cyanobacteria bacterium TGS_CYA1]